MCLLTSQGQNKMPRPNYNRAQKIWHMNDSDTLPEGNYKNVYRVPKNGFIMIIDCANTRDYYLSVNNSSWPAFHKCFSTPAGNGFIPVSKGDFISVSWVTNNHYGNPAGTTDIVFLPLLK